MLEVVKVNKTTTVYIKKANISANTFQKHSNDDGFWNVLEEILVF